MKRILYISHVAWGWIKQRPQFIAEELGKDYEVDCYYAKSNKFSHANNDFEEGTLKVKGFRFWPFERITILPINWTDKINLAIFNYIRLDLESYDYIWITDPRHYFLVKNKIKRQKLIYDCMDDMLEFPYIKKYQNLHLYESKAEEQLLKDADVVLCSAEALKEKLIARYHVDREYHIVNNAISDAITTYKDNNVDIPHHSLVYIGTISGWFDFDSVIEALNRFPQLHVQLYGPVRMQNPPTHERLVFKGLVEHHEILGIMKSAMALIMPFQVNELIESVNPVKLYEYIYAGKPVCAVRYKETEKFSEFATLYTGKEQFVEFVDKCLNGKFHVNEDRMKDFALNNTWKSRAKQVKQILDSLDEN